MSRNPFHQQPKATFDYNDRRGNKTSYNNKNRNNKGGKYDGNKLSAKEKQWGKTKFKPSIGGNSPAGRVETATPWKQFKNEIIQKDLDDKHANSMNVNSDDAQEFMKKREQNYRRMLMNEKQKEPTKWEKFNDDDDDDGEDNNQSNATGKFNNKKRKHATTTGEKVEEEESNSKRQRKQTNYNNNNNTNNQNNTKQIVSDDQLKNFNSLDLNFKQKNDIRKIITKTTCLAKGRFSLEDAVRAMKNTNEKREKKANKRITQIKGKINVDQHSLKKKTDR